MSIAEGSASAEAELAAHHVRVLVVPVVVADRAPLAVVLDLDAPLVGARAVLESQRAHRDNGWQRR